MLNGQPSVRVRLGSITTLPLNYLNVTPQDRQLRNPQGAHVKTQANIASLLTYVSKGTHEEIQRYMKDR